MSNQIKPLSFLQMTKNCVPFIKWVFVITLRISLFIRSPQNIYIAILIIIFIRFFHFPPQKKTTRIYRPLNVPEMTIGGVNYTGDT